MKIETCVNTADEILFKNIFDNSRRPVRWVKNIPEHDGQAVLVGGGPSAADWVAEIRYRQSEGQTIFALNNAARWLEEIGIKPDHQVIVDARPNNVAFVNHAKHHYLASQCDPSLFETAHNVTLWHQFYPKDMGKFEAALPEYDDDYVLVGGGTTVGLCAMALAYTLGYRKLHLYGYDSSYRDDRMHAYAQHDPQAVDCVSTVAGKTFNTTLAMAQQAEFFPQFSDQLLDMGCMITIRGDGLLPWTSQQAAIKPPTEQEKYQAIWAFDEYRKYAPGEMVAERFVEVAKITEQSHVIDFGCGTGRGGQKVELLTFCRITQVDFADNARDVGIDYPFVIADLTQPMTVRGDVGFCTDVMEHIPTEDVKDVVRNVMACVAKCFFQISQVDDSHGELISDHLHLTVKPFGWWRRVFQHLGLTIELAEDHGDYSIFFISNT